MRRRRDFEEVEASLAWVDDSPSRSVRGLNENLAVRAEIERRGARVSSPAAKGGPKRRMLRSGSFGRAFAGESGDTRSGGAHAHFGHTPKNSSS